MANRNRIHKSSVSRRRGPTQPHDHTVETPRERHKPQTSAKRNARRNMTSDKEPWNIDTEENYGAGRKTKRPIEQNRYAPQIGREGKGPADMERRSYWNDAEYEERRFRNNYDDYDRTYQPSHRWE